MSTSQPIVVAVQEKSTPIQAVHHPFLPHCPFPPQQSTYNQQLSEYIRRHNVDKCRTLIENDTNIDGIHYDGATALHEAVYQSNVEIVQLILRKGANINATNVNGDTPLHWAHSQGAHEIAKLLIESGADITIANKKGVLSGDNTVEVCKSTPRKTTKSVLTTENMNQDLLRAIIGRRYTKCKQLIDSGVSIFDTLYDCKTALHVAVESNRIDIVKLLIDNGADVNSETDSGETPLDHASDMHGSTIKLVRLLIESGADIYHGTLIWRNNPTSSSSLDE